jgi:hypothetical protein
MDRTRDSNHDSALQRADHVRRYRKALFAKEAKQLAPLLVALLACGLVLHLTGLVFDTTGPNPIHVPLMVLIPFLFAIGAGPMLVSQEKEQRTLGWIGSLPVRRRSIVLTKLIVGALGLMLCWLISIGMTLPFDPLVFWQEGLNDADFFALFGTTFALLTMGFALTWLLPTAVSSLIALLLASFAAALFGGPVQQIVDTYFWVELDFSALMMINYLILTGIFAVVAVRYGGNSFIADGANVSSFAWPRLFRGRRDRLSRDRLSRERVQGVFHTQSQPSSLIWQIGRQNSLLWVGLLMITVMGIITLCFAFGFEMSESLLLTMLFFGCVVLSWLGASVFGSDAHRQRIRFLAERGVAPGMTWWTRMILPLGCVAIGLLVFYLMNRIWLSQLNSPPPSNAILADVRVPVTIGAMLIFAFTQWISQWTRSTLIAFCIAPAAAIFAVGYQSFASEFLNASWWLLMATFGTALLATRVMMRPWMDGRFGLRYWMSHCAFLAVAVVIPAIPFLITYATYPDMSSAMKLELAAEAEQYKDNSQPITLRAKSNADANTITNNMADAVRDALGAVEQQLLTTEGPVSAPSAIRYIVAEAELLSLRMESSEVENGKSEKEYRERYQRSVVLLSNLARRMRMSQRLLDQEYTDRIEYWLVTELARPGRRELFKPDVYAEIVAGLSDQVARHQGRRRAVVVAWQVAKSNRNLNNFGGMQLPTSRANSMLTSWLVNERDIGVATTTLLRHLEAKQSQSDHSPFDRYSNDRYPEQLHAYWPQSTLEGDLLPTIDFDFVNYDAPGMLWHREWETKATQMVEALK